MSAGLQSLIRTTCVQVGSPNEVATHVLFGTPTVRLRLLGGQVAQFWSGYCDLIEQHPNDYIQLGEKAGQNVPFIVNCEFTFNQNNTRPFGENLTMTIAWVIQQTIIELMDLNLNSAEAGTKLIVVILESDKYTLNTGLDVYQIRLQFPYCVTEATFIRNAFRGHLISRLRRENIMRVFEIQPIGDWESWLTTLTDIVPMYLSTEEEGKTKLEFSELYSYIDPSHLSGQTVPPQLALEDVFFPRNHHHVAQSLLSETVFQTNQDVEHWLPIFLSVNYVTQVTMPKSNIGNPDPTPQMVVHINLIKPEPITDDNHLQIAQILLPCIKQPRANEEEDWIRIGRSLYSCDGGSPQSRDMWIRWSEKGSRYKAEDCMRKWISFRIGQLSIKEIAELAMNDNPEVYERWHSNWCTVALRHAISGLHSDVGVAVYRCYWLDYVCASIENRVWYEYKGHRWEKLDAASGLRMNLRRDFARRIEKMRLKMMEQAYESNNEAEQRLTEQLFKQASALIANMKKCGFRSNIVNDAAELFHNDKFLKIIDKDHEITGLANGVFHATNHSIRFRAGRREDYITKQMPVEFHPDLTADHPSVRALDQWVERAFPNLEIRKFWWLYQASLLRGRNVNKKFMVNWGPYGNNAKSSFANLKEAAFGDDYCIRIPLAAIVKGSGGRGGPSPEIAQIRGARLMIFDEPDEDDELRKAWLKLLTGRDKMFARMCNENGGKFEIMAKVELNCNKIPVIRNPDKATVKRLCIVPHMSEWVEDQKVEQDINLNDGHFLFRADPNFDDNIPELIAPYVWRMFNYYIDYLREGLYIPKEIEEISRKYWENNDIYRSFIVDRIRTVTLPGRTDSTDTNQHLHRSRVYKEFCDWHNHEFPGERIPPSTFFYEEMQLENRLGALVDNEWLGIRFHSQSSNLSFISQRNLSNQNNSNHSSSSEQGDSSVTIVHA